MFSVYVYVYLCVNVDHRATLTDINVYLCIIKIYKSFHW